MSAVPGPIPQICAPRLAIAGDRRREHRRLIQTKGTLTILDGAGAGTAHEIQMRDMSLSGISFMLRQPLVPGQLCRIEMLQPGGNGGQICEVVRARPLSNGKFEMAVKVRKVA